MVYGLWLSAGGMEAQEYRQSIMANNLANVQTPGFKPDSVAFEERLNAAMARRSLAGRIPALGAMTGGLFETQPYTDFAQGNLVVTDGPLDAAIEGSGFFKVQTKDGVRYTRDGRMSVGADGTLIHAASGGLMLDEDGRPIALDPASTGKVSIDSTGALRQSNELVARLGFVDFADRQRLIKDEQNLYRAGRAPESPAEGQVRQGFYEASNVDPVAQLVDMIASTRVYEMNATLLTMQDQSLGRVVTDVGRIG